MRSLSASASRIIAASKPAPAMTAKRSLSKRPTSSLLRSPWRPMATACSMSCGIPRLVAKRFAVPAGMTARGTSVPASTPMQRRTVPSPPQASTSSAPASIARWTCSGAFLAFGTSCHSGSRPPPPRARDAAPGARHRGSSRRARRPRPSCHGLRAARSAGPAVCGVRAACATPAAREANSSTSSAPMPMTRPPATSSGWCMPRYMRAMATMIGIAIAIAQAAMRSPRVESRDVISSTRPT